MSDLSISKKSILNKYFGQSDLAFNDILFNMSNECDNYRQNSGANIAELIELALIRAYGCGVLDTVFDYLSTTFWYLPCEDTIDGQQSLYVDNDTIKEDKL